MGLLAINRFCQHPVFGVLQGENGSKRWSIWSFREGWWTERFPEQETVRGYSIIITMQSGVEGLGVRVQGSGFSFSIILTHVPGAV
jgi:hypothetical protein